MSVSPFDRLVLATTNDIHRFHWQQIGLCLSIDEVSNWHYEFRRLISFLLFAFVRTLNKEERPLCSWMTIFNCFTHTTTIRIAIDASLRISCLKFSSCVAASAKSRTPCMAWVCLIRYVLLYRSIEYDLYYTLYRIHALLTQWNREIFIAIHRPSSIWMIQREYSTCRIFYTFKLFRIVFISCNLFLCWHRWWSKLLWFIGSSNMPRVDFPMMSFSLLCICQWLIEIFSVEDEICCRCYAW